MQAIPYIQLNETLPNFHTILQFFVIVAAPIIFTIILSRECKQGFVLEQGVNLEFPGFC